jgi:hypothetical protein
MNLKSSGSLKAATGLLTIEAHMSVTQKFMGSGQLVDRLTAQVGNRETAVKILQHRGQMDAHGNLTAAGQARNVMTAEERAIDRASKREKHSPKAFKYNPKTNRATLKGR